MPSSQSSLPSDVQDALQRGDKIEAIRLLRETTGLGLKQAKDVIESGSLEPATASVIGPSAAFPPEVIAALHRGRKIEAIKLLRQHAGIGLKDAKDAIDAYQREQRRLYPHAVARDRALWRDPTALLIVFALAVTVAWWVWAT